MKEITRMLAFAFILIFMLHQLGISNTEKQELKEEKKLCVHKKNEWKDKYFDMCAVNIIMMNHMCERDQRYLQKDTAYLELATKYD